MKQLDPTETIAIGFQVQYAIAEGKAIAFSSCLDAECSPTELNAALDKLVDAAERQIARVRVPQLRQELERLEKAQTRAAEDMFRLDEEAKRADGLWKDKYNGEGRRSDFKMSPAQINEHKKREADRNNAEITFKRMEEEIKLRRTDLANLERMTVALPSAANSNTFMSNS